VGGAQAESGLKTVCGRDGLRARRPAARQSWRCRDRAQSIHIFTIEKEVDMTRKHFFTTLALGLFLAIPSISFGQGKVMITLPADGATLDALDENRLVYAVEPGPRGDHVHVYVDDEEVGILRSLKGSYMLETLSSGKRNLCVKVVNKAHVPVGIEQCIQVTVK
jgi:hypothetical protein